MIERSIDTARVMIIGLGGYLVSWFFGDNWFTENHGQINEWMQTFVLILTSIGVMLQLLWNAKKRRNERRDKKKG